jgi:prophage regulatory protein
MRKLAEAKALANEWADQAGHARYEASVSSHFDRCSAHQLIDMWESGNNLKGKPLSKFETQALAEAWCRVFGELPPGTDDEDGSEVEPPATTTPELPADDAMLRTKDVLRLMGVSLSTLKRMVLDSRFPKPLRLSSRRIGWPARDVKAWLDAAEEARAKGRP